MTVSRVVLLCLVACTLVCAVDVVASTIDNTTATTTTTTTAPSPADANDGNDDATTTTTTTTTAAAAAAVRKDNNTTTTTVIPAACYAHKRAYMTAVNDDNNGDITADTVLPSWRLHGDGFHMQLHIDFSPYTDTLRVALELPRAFFLDVAEVEQRYTLHERPVSRARAAAAPPHAAAAATTRAAHGRADAAAAVAAAAGRLLGVSVKADYDELNVHTTYPFDIEAPAFVVPYAVNDVTLTLRRRRPHVRALHVAGKATSAAAAVGNDNDEEEKKAVAALDEADDETTAATSSYVRLSLPIHVRYEMVDRNTSFSLTRLLTREHAYVRRCLGYVAVHTSSTTCGDDVRAVNSSRVDSPAHCVDVPVGVLADLPFVYFTLVALMLIALLVVLVAV